MAKELYKLDLYAILGVSETSSEKQIVKGYRKKALLCHPDKNPDKPKAAEEFHRLSEALEILTDAAAKAAYDRSRKAKKEAEARNEALDSKRKKFKKDLEAREQAAEDRLKAQMTVAAEKNLQKEVERLRREGSRLLEQEQERLRQELKSSRPVLHEPQAEQEPNTGTEIPRLKLKWKAAKDDEKNGGYNEDSLTTILSQYGNVSSLLISSKRNGSAIVEFGSSGVSSKILEEKGLVESPLTIIWLSGKPREDLGHGIDKIETGNPSAHSSHPAFTQQTQSGISTPLFKSSIVCDSNTSKMGFETMGMDGSGKDFESLVLMRMRQAQERKRLIAEMQKEDEEKG